jgi:hypothetical protein
MLTGSNAEWNHALATRAIKTSLWDAEFAVRARGKRLRCIFLSDRLTGNRFDLSLELWWNIIDILRSNQDTSPLVGSLLESSLGTLTNCSGHNIDFTVGELTDVLAHSDQ